MGRERADLGFDDPLEGFDPSDWQSTSPPVPTRLPAEDTRKAAEATGFHSREAKLGGAGEGTTPTQVRRRRTGRNAQFNLKARPETIAAYCAIADNNGWGLGETLEYAVALLQDTYGGKKDT